MYANKTALQERDKEPLVHGLRNTVTPSVERKRANWLFGGLQRECPAHSGDLPRLGE